VKKVKEKTDGGRLKPDAAAPGEKVLVRAYQSVGQCGLRSPPKFTRTPYEKVLDPATGTFTYTILDQDREETILRSKYGASASHRSMSSKDEAEWKRWQTSLLSRIPEQPTLRRAGSAKSCGFWRRRKLALELRPKSKKAEDMAVDDASPKKTSDGDTDDSPTKTNGEKRMTR
jgi:hypothetical protein